MYQNTVRTPQGSYSELYKLLLDQKHLLVAGATGSGKSVVINGMLSVALYHFPGNDEGSTNFILIDPKRVELYQYKDLPHTLYYASEPEDMIKALKIAMQVVDQRFLEMQRNHKKLYARGDIYVVIDEFADLMTTNGKQVVPLIQRLAQVGRAARCHIILATQCPLREILPTKIKCNFDSIVGLRTARAQDSRNILGLPGLEKLPPYGEAYIQIPGRAIIYTDVPFTEEAETERLIKHWMDQKETIKRIMK